MQAFAPVGAAATQDRPRRSTMDNLSRQAATLGQLGGMAEALADSKLVGMASQVFGDASLTPDEEKAQTALKSAQGTFDAKRVEAAAQEQARQRAAEISRQQGAQYGERLQQGRGPGEQARQLALDTQEAQSIYLDNPPEVGAVARPIEQRIQQLAAQRSRVGVELERQGGPEYRERVERDVAGETPAVVPDKPTYEMSDIERRVRRVDDAGLDRLERAAILADNPGHVTIVVRERERRAQAAKAPAAAPPAASTVEQLRAQHQDAIRRNDTKEQRRIEEEMRALSSSRGPDAREWVGEAGQRAVSPATQRLAEQARGRAEDLRVQVTDDDVAALDRGLMAAGTVSEEMRDNATKMLEREKALQAEDNQRFLDQTKRWLKGREPEFELDQEGRPTRVKEPEKPTITVLAGLARMADTPEKQQRVMELAGSYELPYRTLAERFDPQRETRFVRELEQLFPAARKSPVEIALNNAMLATKITGLGVSAEQKQGTLEAKLAKLGIDRAKLAHTLDQDEFKNGSTMDRTRILEMMGLSRIESNELLSRMNLSLRRQELGARREETERERADRERREREKLGRESEQDVEKAQQELEDAERTAAQLKAAKPTRPSATAVQKAKRRPGDPENARVIGAEDEYRAHDAKATAAEQRVRDAKIRLERTKAKKPEASAPAASKPPATPAKRFKF